MDPTPLTAHKEPGTRTGKWLFWVLVFAALAAGALIVTDAVDNASREQTLAVPIQSIEKGQAKPVPAQDKPIGTSEGPYR